MKRVRSALTSVKGVSKAEVSMPDRAVVTIDSGGVEADDLIKAVKKAGYDAKEHKAG